MRKRSLCLYPAVTADALEILAWRNDEVTRKMSGTVELINEASHLEWFEKAIVNPKMMLLIAVDEHTKGKIGMVRFDLNDDFSRAEISININPEFRGKGYGHQCLIYAAEYLSVACPTCSVVEAVVRLENLASIRAFSSAGYSEVAQKKGLMHLRLDIAKN